MRHRWVISCVASLALACGQPGKELTPVASAPTRVTALADAYVKDYFDAFPYQALESGAPDVHPDRLVDNSLAALERWHGREDALLAELRQIPLTTINGAAERITYQFLQNQLESAQAFRVCRTELWNVSPTYTGWQADFAIIAGLQGTKTADDQRHAVARFTELARYLDTEIDNLREGIRLGYTAPRNNVRVVIDQMDAML